MSRARSYLQIAPCALCQSPRAFLSGRGIVRVSCNALDCAKANFGGSGPGHQGPTFSAIKLGRSRATALAVRAWNEQQRRVLQARKETS